MTCGIGAPIKCEVFEIEPKDNTLLYQSQYRLNEQSSQYEFGLFPSPPVGIRMIYFDDWRPKLEGHIENILLRDFDSFPDRCYRGTACAVQKDLLRPLQQYWLATGPLGRVSYVENSS